jgi:cholesterol transport system auxiliary component
MRYLLIGCLALISAACSVADKQPAVHDFGLPMAAPTQQGRATITVNAPTWLWDNRIRYRLLFSSSSQVRFYGLDRWIASPPELLEQLLNFSGKIQGYNLVIRLQDFEQQFDASDRARVVLRFSAEAYSIGNNQAIATKEFYLEQSTKTPDAMGAISGFTYLAQQAAGKIQDWLNGLLDHRK